MVLLSCPKCKGELDITPTERENACPRCGYTYQYNEGILDFIPRRKFYWGEIDEELMRRVNDQALEKGWFSSILDNLSHKPNLLNYLLDPVRIAGIFHCYDPDHNEACLDLGSGWGPISYGLSRFYKTIYSIDGVYERLRFQAIRAKQENNQNIVILRGDMLELPIPDHSIDLVVVNGLLEWIGLSRLDESPRKLQEIFLLEVYRVLKEGGKVLIGIENRFGAQYFAGGKDHSGLRFTSIMPRWVANHIVARSERGKDALIYSGAESSYRTLTYSYWGYKRLLEKIGYISPSIYWAWSSYNYPRVSGKPDGRSVKYYLEHIYRLADRRITRSFFRLTHALPTEILGILVKLFSPAFIIVANKAKEYPSLQDKLVDEGQDIKSFTRLSLGLRTDLKTTYALLGNHGLRKIINITENHNGGSSINFVATNVAPVNGNLICPYESRQIILTANWLSDFQERTRQGNWETESLVTEMNELCKMIIKLVNDDQTATDLHRYKERYLAFIAANPICVVAEHGDFTPRNIFITNKMINPIDWEFQKETGNPLMDPGGFLLSLIRWAKRSGCKQLEIPRSNPIKTFTDAFTSKIALPIKLAPAYYLLRIIYRAHSSLITPIQYLYLQEWLGHLPLCLDFSRDFEKQIVG